MNNNSKYRLAVDVGGTFTDLILFEERTKRIQLQKVPTTPEDIGKGVVGVIRKAEADLAKIDFFLHGTTIGLNAFLQRRGTPTGLITTEGFRDVLEIARTDRPDMYDMLYQKPPLLVPRYLRLEVKERMNARGEVLCPLDESSAIRALETFKQEGVRSIAVCLLHSYANPQHEAELQALIAKRYPEATVSVSHTISKEYYEYERTVSTVVNAYIKPLLETYVAGLEKRFDSGGFRGKFLILRSSGGAMSPAEAKSTPVHTLFSGPSGGVMGATHLSKMTGLRNLITADAGGTSFDVSLILNGKSILQSHALLDDHKLLLPVLDIRSIGAGGGSIAWIDEGNALQVGPQSAGAQPGPICYGRGGSDPTVTDAAVALGYIDPSNFLGGDIALDQAAAEHGIATKIASPLKMGTTAAACGILTIANAKMAGVIRTMTIERGHDPRNFTLVGFGGAGPLFGASLGEFMNVRQVLIPRFPANFSAWGMLSADLVFDLARTQLENLEEVDWQVINDKFAELESEGRAALERDGCPPERQKLIRSIDARYWAQGHFINLLVKNGRLEESYRPELAKQFHRVHKKVYGHNMDEPVVLASFRVRAIGRVPKITSGRLSERKRRAKLPVKGTRKFPYFITRQVHKWTIYDREQLLAGDSFPGPALIEETTSVSVVPPEHAVRVDDFGNILIRRLP